MEAKINNKEVIEAMINVLAFTTEYVEVENIEEIEITEDLGFEAVVLTINKPAIYFKDKEVPNNIVLEEHPGSADWTIVSSV